MPKDIIEHKGYVEAVQEDRVKVHFVTMSACASCHAKGVCTASDMEDKQIEVKDNGNRFRKGEEVKVLLKQTLGFKALFFGYVLPFILVLTFLIILSSATSNEVIAGVSSLGILVPYYWIIYKKKHYFNRVFSFELQKID